MPRAPRPPQRKLPTGPPRAALYIRVSSPERLKDEKGQHRQTTDNQLPALTELARRRGWTVTEVYEDNDSASGSKAGDRPAFARMLADAEAHKFDVLVFWSLDRFTREGTYPTLQYLNRLSGWGVDYASAQEQYLDTAGPFKDAIVAILACIARQESERLGERIKAGLKRVQLAGKKLGKPPAIPDDKLDYFRRADKVYNTRELMKLFGVCRASVIKYRVIVKQLQAAGALPADNPIPENQAPYPTSDAPVAGGAV